MHKDHAQNSARFRTLVRESAPVRKL